MRKILTLIVICLLLVPAEWVQGSSWTAPQPSVQQLDDGDDEYDRIRQALREAVAAQAGQNLAFLVNRIEAFEIKISVQEAFAVLYLAMIDPDTGGPRPSEPGLAFAIKTSSGEWVVTLPADPVWNALLETAPSDLLTPEHKAFWRELNQPAESLIPDAPLTGFLLPWQYGVTRYLSQSMEHDRYDPSHKAHYAFDFYDPDPSEKMWDIYAAKGGTVWMMKEDVPTCYQPTCSSTQPLGNYIVIKDTSTSPTSYQLYLHLKQDSIPDYLVIGSNVEQGALIGVVDNTGQSWGSHLHFMVHTTYNSYWGTSVDITFGDVSINGGRPRRHDGQYYFDFDYCYADDICNTSQAAYVSGNDTFDDDIPPVGGLLAPADYSEVTTNAVALTGWAVDTGSGIGSARFIVNYDGEWEQVGPVYSTTQFSYNWNMCSMDVPDGPVLAAVRVYDGAGNLLDTAGIRRFIKNYSCPVSLPVPANNQILLCAETGYRDCTAFSIGSYADSTLFPGSLGDNDAASILVGSAVQATLYTEEDFGARGESFFGDLGGVSGDPNLIDNLVGLDKVSSLRVAALYEAPASPEPVIPVGVPPLLDGDIATLHWDNTAHARDFQVVISATSVVTQPWQSDTTLYLEGLEQGSYSWKVRARNEFGVTGFSAWVPLIILEDSSILPDPLEPYDDPMDNSTAAHWIATGLWHIPVGEGFWRFKAQDGGYSGSGHLTSRPIHIPSAGFYLRFDSEHHTETRGLHWDQRWVQISVDGGPFHNIVQIYDDQPDLWARSTVIDLSAYAGQNIRVRFHFDTLDGVDNFVTYSGWGIDNFSINNTAPPVCTDPAGDDPGSALTITSGSTVDEIICPAGDQDYFVFDGVSGNHIAVDVDVTGSPVNGLLYLLDGDGVNSWAESIDMIPQDEIGPQMGIQLPYTGEYYLRMIDWAHPGTGGPEYEYSISFAVDNTRPSVSLVDLETGGYINGGLNTITVEAADTGSGVAEVRFYWHSPDYAADTWVYLASDIDGSDGWSVTFDPSDYMQTRGYALIAIALDKAGNTHVDAAWNLEIDVAPPVTSLLALDPVQASTAFPLVMTGTDNLSGIDTYEIQERINSGNWNIFYQGPVSSHWVVGDIGSSYEYQSRAVDNAGNQEELPAGAETGTTIPLDVCSNPDEYEQDDTYELATPVITGELQAHNFCLTGGASPLGDVDWLVMDVVTGTHYTVTFIPTGVSSAGHLSLFTDPSLPPLIETSSRRFGDQAVLEFVAEGGKVFIRVQHTNPDVAGNGVSYTILITDGYQLILPAVIH